jgi:putative radical SAM enzyme (TIGR03279 family)
MKDTSLYGVIASVTPGGPADLAGITPGDVLTHVNGRPVRDVIDVQFHAAEPDVCLTLQRGTKTLKLMLEKDIDDSLGIAFQQSFFDGVRTCQCRCKFCFYDQMPPGLRPSLYVKDDDYRLSFLHGTYLTLTNLTDEDYERIAEQRLSPLYVSVHATDPSVRNLLMGNKRAGEVMVGLRRLTKADIQVHTQIVVCPGINDGEVLDRSIRDLASLHPGVASLSVVPLGLTRFSRSDPEIGYPQPVGPAEARAMLKVVHVFQTEFLPKLGTRFVFASDEIYLRLGTRVPAKYRYEDFPQLDNGVGSVRVLTEEAGTAIRRISRGFRARRRQGTLVTGTMLEPVLSRVIDRINHACESEFRVAAIPNRFLGTSVTTAGLMAGRDIVTDLSAKPGSGDVIVPAIALRDGLFVDDVSLAEVQERLSRAVAPAHSLLDVLWPESEPSY